MVLVRWVPVRLVPRKQKPETPLVVHQMVLEQWVAMVLRRSVLSVQSAPQPLVSEQGSETPLAVRQLVLERWVQMAL
jgi:hypothetical protein